VKAVRALGLAFVLSGCLPVAMLRPPEPARGAGFSLGATLMPNPFGGQSPVLLLPYRSCKDLCVRVRV